MKKNHQRNLLLILGGIVLVTVFSLIFIPAAINVETQTIIEGPMMVTINEDGKVMLKEHYTVSAPVDGQLHRIELKSGDKIVATQSILAIIEPSEPAMLDVRSHTQAQAKAEAAKATEKRALAQLKLAQEAKALAQHTFDRSKQLQLAKAISKDAFDQAEHGLLIAQEQEHAAQFALQTAIYETKMAEAVLARFDISKTKTKQEVQFEITSPISGRVLRVFQESATSVTSGAPLLEIGDTSELEVKIEVLSTDAIKINQGAKVFINSSSEQWLGRVRVVEPAAFTKISALGVEEQRVNVVVDFERKDSSLEKLGDGYRIDGKIVIWEGQNIKIIPSSAVFQVSSDWATYLVSKGCAKLQTIQLGHSNGQETEVISGLDIGDEVIIYPSDSIRDGVRVK